MKIGENQIDFIDRKMTTTLGEGLVVTAVLEPQAGQDATAKDLGMSVFEMNATHDLTHTMLAHWMGMEHSPTLLGVATENLYSGHEVEEAAVLAVQRYAKILGVDLISLGYRVSDMDEKTKRLMEAAQELVDSVQFDDCGMMLAGKWQGGNGGMISRETTKKADSLRRAIDAIKRLT